MELDGARWSSMELDAARCSSMQLDAARCSSMQIDAAYGGTTCVIFVTVEEGRLTRGPLGLASGQTVVGQARSSWQSTASPYDLDMQHDLAATDSQVTTMVQKMHLRTTVASSGEDNVIWLCGVASDVCPGGYDCGACPRVLLGRGEGLQQCSQRVS